jgi:hypothetical protein
VNMRKRTTIEPGKAVALGNLEWAPVRHGNNFGRSASRIAQGRNSPGYAHDGMFLLYAKLIPTDSQLRDWEERLFEGLVFRTGAAQ